MNYIGAEGYSISKDVMYGYRITWRRPFRTQESKWYVPNDEYSNLYNMTWIRLSAVLPHVCLITSLCSKLPTYDLTAINSFDWFDFGNHLHLLFVLRNEIVPGFELIIVLSEDPFIV
jgi:hypothetical protein